MDITLLSKLLNNLLSVNVFIIDKDFSNLDFFEKTFNKDKMIEEFTTFKLQSYLSSLNDNVYYELVSRFKIRISFFKYENNIILIGPYIKKLYTDEEINKLIFRENISPSFFNWLRNYYYNCTTIDYETIQKTINAIFLSFNITQRQFSSIKKFYNEENSEDIFTTYDENNNLNAIYKKYQLENNLLDKITEGKVDEVEEALYSMYEITDIPSYNIYLSYDMSELLSSFRALVRKAAEKSGLSLLIIDNILSKYTQLQRASKSIKEQNEYYFQLTLELTKAVKNHLLNEKKYSIQIQKIREYIFYRYTSEIKSEELEKFFHLNFYYIEHLFKKEVGISIHQFIKELRINKAKQLLTKTDLTISEVASSCGYLDNNYFTKVFKQYTKMNPSEYKKMNAK